jgi:hypothetical protein
MLRFVAVIVELIFIYTTLLLMSSTLTPTVLGVNNSTPTSGTTLHSTGQTHQLGTMAFTNTATSTSTAIRGLINLNDSTRTMEITNNGATALSINSTGAVTIPVGLTLTSGFTLPASIVTSYTPTVTAGANLTPNGASTGRYMNLGGIKMAWGEINLRWTTNNDRTTTTTATLPASFFTTIHTFIPSISTVGMTAYQAVTGDGYTTGSESIIKFYNWVPLNNAANSTTSMVVSFLVIGT